MSTSVSTAFVAEYEADVHHLFQRKGAKLLGTVRYRPDVVGSTDTFQKIGTGAATTKSRHGQITPMNVDHTTATVTLSDFYAGDWVDKLDESKIKHDERQALAKAGSMALGRKVDDQILASMDGTTQDVTLTYTSKATILNSALDLIETLRESNVDDEIFVVVSPHMWSALMLVEQFGSSRYVTDMPYQSGNTVKEWQGAKWFMHNGVPGRGTSATKGYAYAKSAVGYATGVNTNAYTEGSNLSADITWHGDRAAHFINHMMSGGAVMIDSTGVVEFDSDDTAALPTS